MLAWLLGLGFGVPAAYGTWYYAAHRYVWTFMGFPTHSAEPPFLGMGLDTSVPLLAAFVAVFRRDRHGRPSLDAPTEWSPALGRVLPLEFAFWIGFVLPFAPVVGISRVVLVLMS